jgi:hypothetical protein
MIILGPFCLFYIRPNGIFDGHFSRFGKLYREKSGNPDYVWFAQNSYQWHEGGNTSFVDTVVR